MPLILLCMVPILGGIIGVISLILRLFFYRNGLLIIMGIAGLFFSYQYFNLKYHSTHGGPFDKPRIMAAKSRLRILFSQIEMYKEVNGFYPATLEGFKKNGIDIIDPVQSIHPDSSDHAFFYLKRDDRYFLFSKGLDGAAFTQDDILPNTDDFTTRKIGIVTDSIK